MKLWFNKFELQNIWFTNYLNNFPIKLEQCSAYAYRKTSFNKAWIQFLCRSKSFSLPISDFYWWESDKNSRKKWGKMSFAGHPLHKNQSSKVCMHNYTFRLAPAIFFCLPIKQTYYSAEVGLEKQQYLRCYTYQKLWTSENNELLLQSAKS